MEQKEIEVGKTYLFVQTEVPHRKDQIGKPFTVVRARKAKKHYSLWAPRPPEYRFYNELGQTAHPNELIPLHPY